MLALLQSGASSWITADLGRPPPPPPSSTSSSSWGSSGPAGGAPLLEVALPSRAPPALRVGGAAAPVHHMGGGPRTFPGGVTKWQWKRMQLKKSRQIEKARLLREKHMYEARRRAELQAASPVLEMPWQKLSRVRPPNYVTADEQITKLAARFQRSGGEDLWTEEDGPERFEVLEDESSTPLSDTNAPSKRASSLNPQYLAPSNEPSNRVQNLGPALHHPSFRHTPSVRSESSSYSDSLNPWMSRRPESDEQSNNANVDRLLPYSQYMPRIRPGLTPHQPQTSFRKNPRRQHG